MTKFLWEKFRRELSRYFDPKNLEFFGPLELDKLAEFVRFSSDETFWGISRAMLECADERENAQKIDGLLKRLLALSQQELRAALAAEPSDWDLLQEFSNSLSK